jgi:hypothetical protein
MTPIVEQLLASPRDSNMPNSRFQRHTHTPHFSHDVIVYKTIQGAAKFVLSLPRKQLSTRSKYRYSITK